MKLLLLLVTVALVSAVEHRATVTLSDPEGKTGVVGNLSLVQVDDGPVLVTGVVTGLSPGLHGFHVHENSDIAVNCNGAGGHYNPFNMSHGAPNDTDRHVGDLGNIAAGEDRVAHVNISDTVIRLVGANSIENLTVVVHSDRDDLGKEGFVDSRTTGHAGSRLACGRIATGTTGQSASSHSTGSSSSTITSTTEAQHRSDNQTVQDDSGSPPLHVSWVVVALLSAVVKLC